MMKPTEHPEIADLDPEARAMFYRVRARIGLADVADGITPAVAEALARARADGFAGRVVSTVAIGDDRHEMHVVEAEFSCGGRGTYIVAADRHEGGGCPVLLPLSEAVHVLQNVTDTERWEISGRDPVAPHQIGDTRHT